MSFSRGRPGCINRGQDALWQAVSDRDAAAVQKLVEQDHVEVDFIAPDGWVRDAGSGGKSLLHHAAWVGDLSIFRMLVEKGANPAQPRARNWARAKGFTPFHHACFYNRVPIVLYCLDSTALGVDVNAIGEDGFTGLHLAAKFGYEELCRVLLDHGARMDLRNRQDKLAFDLASKDEIKELMLKYKTKKLVPSVAPSDAKPTVCLIGNQITGPSAVITR